jgi:hypothetical protein
MMPFFVIESVGLGSVALRDLTFITKSAREAIWSETHNQIRGWLPYQAKSYQTSESRDLVEIRYSFPFNLWRRRASF